MALIIVATPGASNANSYCTLAEANTYHEGHPYPAAWDAAGQDDRNRALKTATSTLDELVEWKGDPTTPETQALRWPRAGMLDHNGYPIASNVIPQKLKEATAEFARQLLESNRLQDMQQESQGLESLEAGGIAMKFRNDPRPKVIPDAVWQMIRNWGTIVSRKSMVTSLLRG